PDVRLDTDVARSLIPAAIDHDIAAENSARSGLLVHGLVNDPSALFEATSDKLHQEFRRSVYPESMALVDTLRGQGLPAVVSGAWPTGCALRGLLPAISMPAGISDRRTSLDLGGYRVSEENCGNDSRDRLRTSSMKVFRQWTASRSSSRVRCRCKTF